MPDHRSRSTAAVLAADPYLAAWAAALAKAGLPAAEVAVPSGSALADVLLDLGVPYEVVNPILAARAALAADEKLTDLLTRCVRVVVRDMGTPCGNSGDDSGNSPPLGPDLPPLPSELGAPARWFTLFTLIGALPYTRAYHRAHGIPADITRRTLADAGRHVALHGRRHGTPGVLHPSWLLRGFRGTLFQLGRLQYERALLGGTMGRHLADAGLPTGPGEPVLMLHIPDFRGPLTPADCAASLAEARAFFPRHFPRERPAAAVCYSWLLDPQLAEYLPPDANIPRFQSLFHPGPPALSRVPDDRSPVGFVFGDPELSPYTLPTRSTLERAIVGHLRAGRHWYGGTGWFGF